MSALAVVTAVAAIAGLGATAVMALVRIVRGPTILDRMVASDVLLTTLLMAVGADMVVRGHTENIPLMTAIAATAVLATITVARFVRRRSGEQRPARADDAAGDPRGDRGAADA